MEQTYGSTIRHSVVSKLALAIAEKAEAANQGDTRPRPASQICDSNRKDYTNDRRRQLPQVRYFVMASFGGSLRLSQTGWL